MESIYSPKKERPDRTAKCLNWEGNGIVLLGFVSAIYLGISFLLDVSRIVPDADMAYVLVVFGVGFVLAIVGMCLGANRTLPENKHKS
jgi:hypothetical protein